MMSMKSSVPWIAAGALGAGLAYVAYSRRGRSARDLLGDGESSQSSPPESLFDDSVDVDFSEPISVLSSEITVEDIQEISSSEIPIELVTDQGRATEEPYDTLSTESLGTEWLNRATEGAPRPQIPDSIEAALSSVWDAEESADDTDDFAARPTDPMIDVASLEHPSELPPSARVVRQPSGRGRALASTGEWTGSSDNWELPEDRK